MLTSRRVGAILYAVLLVVLWRVLPPRASLASLIGIARRPGHLASQGAVLGCLGCTAWLSLVLAGSHLVRFRSVARRSASGSHALARVRMTRATLGGAESDCGGASRRWSDRFTATHLDHPQRDHMPEPSDSARDEPPADPPAPSLLATAALLAARRRWSQSRDADPAASAGNTGSSAGGLDRRLALIAPRRQSRPAMPAVHLEDPEWSRAVLGLLSVAAPTRHKAVALLLHADRVDIEFAGAVRVAAPPLEARSRTGWSLPRQSGALADLPSTPTIVTASRRAALVTAYSDPSCRCLVDLVGCGTVALDGPPVAVGATLSDVVIELATRRWCDLDELVVVGFGSEIAGLERALCIPDIDTATRWLLACADDPALAARARCLVVAPPIGRKSAENLHPLRSLVELVHVLPATGLICCDPTLSSVRTLWRLSAHRETLDISWRRRQGTVLRLRPEDARAEDGTRAEASGEEPVVDGEALEVDWGFDGEEDELTESAATPVDPEEGSRIEPAVIVRVLGPVDVVNAAMSLDRKPRVTELVVYLALHRDGCSGEAIANAVWAERRVPPQTLANRLSEARQAFGETDLGLPRLRRVSGRHVLTPDVTTDWAEFERLTRPGSGAAEWTAALELVRGRPFEGLTESGWALLEGFLPAMEGRIVDTACRLAAHSLEEGNASHAEWAIRRGLAAAPWDERLYRRLMVISHATGNRGGIDSALRSFAHVLDWAGNPLEVVHPETVQLYRQLIVDRALDR